MSGGGKAIYDHGTLQGLTDNDHTQYALLTGAVFSGAVTATDLTATGDVSCVNINTSGSHYQTGGAPLEARVNSTLTNADGGRAVTELVVGYTAAGTLHYLHYSTISHDGAGADQRGRVTEYINDGNDGTAPTLHVTKYGVDHRTVFEGEVRHPFGRIYRRRHSVTQSFNNTTATILYDSSDRADTGWSYSAGEFTSAFAGDCLAKCRMIGEITSGSLRVGQTFWLEKYDGVSAWNTVVGSMGGMYHRVTGTDVGDTSEAFITVASGEKYRWRSVLNIAAYTVRSEPDHTWASFERVQETS